MARTPKAPSTPSDATPDPSRAATPAATISAPTVVRTLRVAGGGHVPELGVTIGGFGVYDVELLSDGSWRFASDAPSAAPTEVPTSTPAAPTEAVAPAETSTPAEDVSDTPEAAPAASVADTSAE